MAMPSDDSFVPDDENQERAPNVELLALISSRIFHMTILLG